MKNTKPNINEIQSSVFQHVRNSIDKRTGLFDLNKLQLDLREFSDQELRLTSMMEGIKNDEVWSVAIALCKSEIERRKAQAASELALRTTKWSVGIGAAATIVGGALGAIATVFVFWVSDSKHELHAPDNRTDLSEAPAMPASD